MNNEKGNFALLMVIMVATLLISVVGASFAYFGATMDKNSESTTIEVTSGTATIEFLDNSVISGGNVATGTVIASKTFTVTGTVTGSNNLNYDAILNVSNNTYSDGALVYTLTSTNESNNGTVISSTTENVAIPTGENSIVLGKGTFTGPITGGAKHTYTLTITYVGTADMDKTIDAKISLEQSNN